MLGETYELVTDTMRYIAEKVEHDPVQTQCFVMEGKDYLFSGYQKQI